MLSGRDALKSDYCTYFSREEIDGLVKGKFEIEAYDTFGFYYLIPSPLRRTKGILFAFDKLMNNCLTRKVGIVNFFKLRRL